MRGGVDLVFCRWFWCTVDLAVVCFWVLSFLRFLFSVARLFFGCFGYLVFLFTCGLAICDVCGGTL